MLSLFQERATSSGGRAGRVRSSDGQLDLQLAMPTVLGGPGGTGTNPEQLFAAAYAACFSTSVELLARAQRLELGKFEITAEISFNKTAEGFSLSARLLGRFDTLDRERALALMQHAHGVCPYSKATRGNVPVELIVT